MDTSRSLTKSLHIVEAQMVGGLFGNEEPNFAEPQQNYSHENDDENAMEIDDVIADM